MKRVIAQFNTDYKTIQLIGSFSQDSVEFTPKELNEIQTELYNIFVNYWFYSEIGFDSDDMFVQRLNSCWERNIDKYELLIQNNLEYPAMTTTGNYTDTNKIQDKNIQTKENTVTPDLNSNTVNKGRNVEIMNTTTDTTGTTTSTDNNTDNRTRDESLVHSNNNTTIYSTGDEIRKVLENTAIRNDWIHCFDNLFMEVL